MLETTVCVLVLVFPASFAIAEENAKPAQPEVNVSQKQIDHWIANLDSDRFDLREQAQVRLDQSGLPALGQVAQEARNGSLESSTRAINILLSWSESSDDELRMSALESIASLNNRPKESNIASTLLSDAREQATLKKLTKLGATFNQNYPGMAYLHVIVGKKWRGGIEGLKYLKELPNASIISFRSTPMDDKSLETLLDLPESSPNLKKLEFYGTGISKSASDELKEKMPHIIIDIRESGAFLGIRGTKAGAVIVLQVQPASAAQKAGIQRNDVITHINDNAVKNFEELTQYIAKHQPGDTALLKVVRKNKKLNIKVKFDEWGVQDQNQAQQVPNLTPANLVPKKVFIERR